MKDNKIIHRDLKPANIFLNSFNILKIGDYGLAKSLSRTTQMAGTYCGTPVYMAPDLLEGKEYSHGADIWAMGCVFYEIITLNRTFTTLLDAASGKFKPIPTGVHPRTSRIVSQILVVDPSLRPSADQIGYKLFKTRPKVYRCGNRSAAITAMDFEDSLLFTRWTLTLRLRF